MEQIALSTFIEKSKHIFLSRVVTSLKSEIKVKTQTGDDHYEIIKKKEISAPTLTAKLEKFKTNIWGTLGVDQLHEPSIMCIVCNFENSNSSILR